MLLQEKFSRLVEMSDFGHFFLSEINFILEDFAGWLKAGIFILL